MKDDGLIDFNAGLCGTSVLRRSVPLMRRAAGASALFAVTTVHEAMDRRVASPSEPRSGARGQA